MGFTDFLSKFYDPIGFGYGDAIFGTGGDDGGAVTEQLSGSSRIPYGGQLTAPLSQYEQLALSELGNFFNTPITGELFGAAKGQILDTLGGRYADPATSPFIQAMTRLSSQNLGDLITQARGRRGARGTYFTRAGIQEEGQLAERSQNYLNALIGQFINQERGRQMQAIPFAFAGEEYGGLTAPLRRVQAGLSYGAVPRLLEQADLERQYNEFTRQTGDVGVSSVQEPSSIQQILGALGNVNFGGNDSSSKQGWGDWLDLALKVLPVVLG